MLGETDGDTGRAFVGQEPSSISNSAFTGLRLWMRDGLIIAAHARIQNRFHLTLQLSAQLCVRRPESILADILSSQSGTSSQVCPCGHYVAFGFRIASYDCHVVRDAR
jgi:hypothetical protein